MNIYQWAIAILIIAFIWAVWSYKKEMTRGEHEHAKKHLAKERVIYQSSSSD